MNGSGAGLEDIDDFDHELLKSMGIESAKHRLLLIKWCKEKVKDNLGGRKEEEEEEEQEEEQEKEKGKEKEEKKSKKSHGKEEKKKGKAKKGKAKESEKEKSKRKRKEKEKQGAAEEEEEIPSAMAFGSEMVYAGPDEMDTETFQEDLNESIATLARKVRRAPTGPVETCANRESNHAFRTGRSPTMARHA